MEKANLIVPAHYIKPRCEAKLSNQASDYNRRMKYKNADMCHNQASIKINGKCLCRKHASIVALDILLKNGEVQS